MRRIKSSVAAAVILLLAMSPCVYAQQPAPPILSPGNAVVTGFSGVVLPDPQARRPANKAIVDLTFINPDGPSARIVDLGYPQVIDDGRDTLWDASLWPATKPRDIQAKDVGQVFGVALDNETVPNIYLAATSAFGLNIVHRAADGTIERLKTGGPGAQWQNGQFGLALQGGPGSIYKVDGKTGAVTLFANVMLDGVPNPGPGLGGLAYDDAHKQLFVSDLYTGLIHRFAIADGTESGPAFDHGVTARTAVQLPPLAFDPRNRLNIAVPKFDSTNPETWGYAPPERRVWGLAVHDGRLYYSARNGAATDGPQVWSVGIERDGSFSADPRWELDVPALPGPYPVSDIAFAQKGAMILAQRAPVTAAYDYSTFTKPGEPRVLRYWLENPDDPNTPSKWIAQPEEYAVGLAGTWRNTNGGIALGFGYGYGKDGRITETVCEYALWSTGQNLRNNPAMRALLEPGGPLIVHGVQGAPAAPVRNFNEPPTITSFIDYDDRFEDPTATGHLGGIRIRGCGTGGGGAAALAYGGPGFPAEAPYLVASAVDGGGRGGGGGGGSGGGGGGGRHRTTDIALKKTAGTVRYDQTSATWTVEFKIDVTNVGMPFTPGTAISIKDPVPAGLTFASASGVNWSCAVAAGNVNCGYTSNSGLFNTGAHLNQLVLTFTTKAPRTYENCATAAVGAGPRRETNLGNNRDCTSIVVPPQSPKACFASTGAFECNAQTGHWVYKLTATGPAWVNAVTATSQTSGVSVPAGPISLNPAAIGVSGPPGTSATIEVCAFDATAAASGKPYNCCRAKITVTLPAGACGVRQ